MERQFHRYFGLAEKAREITGEKLLLLLEQRLDNMIYRMGFATSRAEARQLVRHGHFLVDGRKVDIPSYLLQARPGRERGASAAARSPASSRRWSRPNAAACRTGSRCNARPSAGRVKALPTRADLTMPINEKLVVELYSK